MSTPFNYSLTLEQAGEYLKQQFCTFGLEPYVHNERAIRIMLGGALRRKEIEFLQANQEIDFTALKSWVEESAKEALIKIAFMIANDKSGKKDDAKIRQSFCEHLQSTGLFTAEQAQKHCTPVGGK